MLRRTLLSVFAAAGLLAAGLPHGARAQTEGADAFIRKVGGEVIAVLENASLQQADRERVFHNMLTRYMDVDSISRTVLGRYWQGASETEREDFKRLYREYVVRIYAQRFSKFSGEEFVVRSARDDGDNNFLVVTAIEPKDGPAYLVNWRVRRQSEGYKVIDVMAEGVSLLITHNQEFASVIRNNGGRVSALNDALRRRTGTQ